MRKQARPPKPAVLVECAERWTQQWLDLRQRNPAAPFPWYQIGGKTAREWLLPELLNMTQGHCSFCDAFPLEDRSKTPIEHFRPKTAPQFADQAYAWENLYCCCERCQASKGERWDQRLLRPDAEDYECSKYFQFDWTTGEMKPNEFVEIGDDDRAKKTIELYDLDHPSRRRLRRLELWKWQRTNHRVLDDWAYRDFLGGENRR